MGSSAKASSSAFTKLRHDSSRDKYYSWREPMLHLLQTKNLLGFINNDLPETTTEEWTRIDQLIRDSILETLSDGLVPTVAACRTSRDVWLRLETLFTQPSTAAHQEAEEEGYRWMPLALYNAALRGDWDATREILEGDPEASEARVAPNLDTALHIAVGTGKAIPYLRNLVSQMRDESLEVKNATGKTALHVAALMGNLEAAKILVHRHPGLLYSPDRYGYFPVVKAAMSAHRPTLQFFISHTKDDVVPNLYAQDHGVDLLECIIDAEFFGN